MRRAAGLAAGVALWLLTPMALAAPASAQLPAAVQTAFDHAKDAMITGRAEALRYVVQAEALARTMRDPRQRAIAFATAQWLYAEAEIRYGDPEKAASRIAEGLREIASIPEPLKVRGDLLMSRGQIHIQHDQAVEALGSFQEAYRIFGAVNQPRSQSIALQSIATLYLSANDTGRAEAYYRQAGEVYDGDAMLSLALHNGLGSVLLQMDRYADAEIEFKKALVITVKLEKPMLEARVLVNLARTLVDLKHFAEADAAIARGFELAKGDDSDALRRQLYATAARLAADRGDFAQAEKMIRDCFRDIDLKTTTVAYRNAHLYAYDIYGHLGEAKLALAHLESLKRLNDESAKVAMTTGAALMAARFNFAEQKERIATLKAEEARRTAEFQRTLFLSLGGATLVVIALLSFGLVTIRRSRNQVRAANVILNETNVALEKALKAKTEFLATTSHEIRTPLNGILGMTQVMLADSSLQPQMRDRLGIVHGAGLTMRSLVDDILDVAKMETGNLTVEIAPMDLRRTLGEVTRIWEEQARGKGLGFALDIADAPDWIESDAGRLRQIVFNLLSNAIKFTENGVVSVRAAAEGDRLRLTVRDSGIGIPPEKCEEIFESFRQADSSTTRQFGGTGLGLTICRNLARALGGDITVSSRVGEGAAFIVELPLVRAEAPADAARPLRGSGAILVLDRNPIARSMIRTVLEPQFGQVRFAGTADEAIAMIAEGGVIGLLADDATLKAGALGPLDLLRSIAAAAEEIPIAVLWLKPEAQTITDLLDAGASQVIEKPVAGAALVEALNGWAGKSANGEADPLVSRAA